MEQTDIISSDLRSCNEMTILIIQILIGGVGVFGVFLGRKNTIESNEKVIEYFKLLSLNNIAYDWAKWKWNWHFNHDWIYCTELLIQNKFHNNTQTDTELFIKKEQKISFS